MAADTIKVVKNKNTGVIFAYSDRLAAQKHMITGFLNLKTQKFTRSEEPDEGSPMAETLKRPDATAVVTDPAPDKEPVVDDEPIIDEE